MFCSQCGKQLDSKSEFCTQCGFKLDSQSEPDQHSAVSSPETAVWVFNAQRKYSMLKMIPCNIVFMQDIIVLAHLTPELQKAESAKASQEIKAKGLGFFKGSAAMMRYWANFSKKYYAMGTKEILAEDPSNMVLHYQDINAVLFRAHSGNVDDSHSTPGKLNFSLISGETIKFSHTESSNKETKQMLMELFRGKLKYKR